MLLSIIISVCNGRAKGGLFREMFLRSSSLCAIDARTKCFSFYLLLENLSLDINISLYT